MSMNALAVSTLKQLQIAVQARDRAAPFRTFFDNFFAYYIGGPYLSLNGRPLWLNNPCPRRHRDALSNAHFVSVGALRVLAGLSDDRLIKDHAVPVSTLREILMESECSSLVNVEQHVRRFYRIGIITSTEDDSITAAGLRSQMPSGWRTADGPFARYEAVGITAQQLRDAL